MKKFFFNYHHEIDIFSSGLFLYFLFAFLFLIAFDFFKSEILQVSFSLIFPIFFINSKLINVTNELLHRIFRFRR